VCICSINLFDVKKNLLSNHLNKSFPPGVPFVGSSPNNKCQLRKIEEDTLEIIDANSSDLSVGSKDFLYGLNYENEAWSSSYAHLKNAVSYFYFEGFL